MIVIRTRLHEASTAASECRACGVAAPALAVTRDLAVTVGRRSATTHEAGAVCATCGAPIDPAETGGSRRVR